MRSRRSPLVLALVAVACGRDASPRARDPELARTLAAAVARRGPAYQPRTRHRRPDGSPTYTNRLILETSPYLLQHAHNPVDWHPWGEAAFAKAQREDKPILLSIGYSTCHWCHVMEEESFEDVALAQAINRAFVPIKVDREERPEVDAIYVAAVEQLTGSSGWPLTVFLLPDRRPFFGGTYFPPRDGMRGMRVGLGTLVETLAAAYRADRASLVERAATVVAELERGLQPLAGDLPGSAVIREGVQALAATFDATWGGFGAAPKFPRPAALALLLRYHRRSGDAQARHIVERTLERMAAGGIHDQLGGGFHRYAVDARWREPHFEKMLYDNAQLAALYVEAAQLTGRADFAATARATLDFVLRELAAPGGGFHAAIDADSGGEEGTYYTWTAAELARHLDAEHARVLRAYYDVPAAGRGVLWRPAALAEVAAALDTAPGTVEATLAAARPRLLAARARRAAPHVDRKLLVAWNGLAISAFARAALAFDEPRYRDAARAAATRLLAHARDGAYLARGLSEGRPIPGAVLDDYAWLAAGLLDLFEADPDPRWLREAIALQRVLDAAFHDAAGGGYFYTAAHHARVLVREKPDREGDIPGGNAVVALTLLRLHQLTGDEAYRARAEATLRAFAGSLALAPSFQPSMLIALDFALDQPAQIVMVAPPGTAADALLAPLRAAFVPNRVLVRVTPGAAPPELAPLVEDKRARGGEPTAYVCVGTHCERPTQDPAVLAKQLAKPTPYP